MNWCYVHPDVCDDGEYVDYVNDEVWLYNKNIKVSSDACSPDYKVEFELGNEKMMDGVEITTDELNGILTNGTEVALSIDGIEESEDCLEECKSRCECGAWSYDNVEGICFLHSVDACCAQKNKQKINPDFISGYVCPACSSTKNECPCTITERRSHCTLAHSSGASKPDYNGPTGLSFVSSIVGNVDPCACEYREFKKGRQKCRCVQPQCQDDVNNASGTCRDKRRCRERKLHPTRFPTCTPN